jgi:hypothetical protein
MGFDYSYEYFIRYSIEIRLPMKNVVFSFTLFAALASSFSGMAANRYWIAATTANWNSAANWSATSGGAGGASVPSTTDIANFDNNGLGNSNIPASVTISGLVINAGYTGTITQSANPITISGAATLAGGSFVGSSSPMTIGGALTLSGTNFTLPATLNVNGAALTYTGGTLDPLSNTSTAVFGAGMTITGSVTLNNVIFNNTTPWAMTFTLASGTVLTIDGNMAMTGTQSLNFSGGTIDLLGNLSLSNTGTGGGGSTVLTFDGTTEQAITGSPTLNESNLPSVNINKASGTLTFPAFVSSGGSAWTYTAGAVDVTTNNGTVAFVGNITITGTQTLNNIQFDNSTPWAGTYTIAAGTTITATDMTFSGASSQTFTGGTIDLQGNLILTNSGTGGGGSTVIAFTGTTAQAITSSLPINEGALPSVNIDKTSGTLTLPSILTMAGSTWTYTTGTIDATTNSSTVVFDGNTTITGSHTLNNLLFNNTTPWTLTYTFATGTVLTAAGNMTISGASAVTLSGGTIDLQGNLTLTNTSTGDGGTTVITFTGTTNQAISSGLPVGEGNLPSVAINKASGTLTLPSILSVAGSAWTYTTGTIDAVTNSSTVVFGGNTTIAGSHTLKNIQISSLTPWNITTTIAAGTVLTAAGNMTMSGTPSITLSGGTIDLQGNLSLMNTSTGDGGSMVLAFTGSANQAITSALPEGENSLPAITINKSSGTLSLPSILTVAGNAWTYIAGTVDATTAASTVYFTANNTIQSAGMSLYNLTVISGTSTVGNALTVAGNLTITSPGVLASGANTINLAGNWSDWGNAGFTEATSTVNFDGSAFQTITAPGGEIFANMTTNNSASNIQLINNITISKTLTMTQGNIDLNGNTLILGLSTANPGTLVYTAGSMINMGSVTRWFKAGVIPVGSVTGLFPVGNPTNARPFSVSAPAAGPTTGGTMTVSYTDGSTTNAVSFPDGAFTVSVIKNLNWALSTGNGLTGGTYDLGISGTGYGLINSINDLRLTLASSVVGTAGVNAGTTADPQVNRTGLSLANLSNTFYLGSINPTMTTLPIELSSFAATPANGEIVLNWSTAQEMNSDYFTVQRSADGSTWQDLQQVAAAGNSTTVASYTAYDRSPLAGASYYRLMITNNDGGTTYSVVVSVSLNEQVSGISVYPNPAVNFINITFSTAGDYTLTLVTETGQILATNVSENTGNLVWDVSNRIPGIYFIQIRSHNGRSETKKIIIRR